MSLIQPIHLTSSSSDVRSIAPSAAASPMRRKRRRSGTMVESHVVRGNDGGAQPNNIGAESPKPNTASQDPQPQANNETGKPERARKLGEPRHDIQKRLQWQYDQKQSKYKHITHAGRVSFVPLIAASKGHSSHSTSCQHAAKMRVRGAASRGIWEAACVGSEVFRLKKY